MRVVFRADASVEAGIGHVMRCLTLANDLALRGASCHFICRKHPGHLADRIRDANHSVTLLDAPESQFAIPAVSKFAGWLGATVEMDAVQSINALDGEPVDWLIIDHYGIDQQWEGLLRPYVKNVMVIDDLADRTHDCDLLLDQNLGRMDSDYSSLCPSGTPLLLGPQYALLRPEFSEWREWALANRSKSRQILISLGGTDSSNVTAKVLQIINEVSLSADWSILVVLGSSCPHIQQVKSIVHKMSTQTELLIDANNMAELMANSALSIGASGSTSWERCSLGVPSLLLVTAENQQGIADNLIIAGAAHEFSHETFVALSDNGPRAQELRDNLALRAAALCDGLGSRRALDALNSSCEKLSVKGNVAFDNELLTDRFR